ncbi:uncharacterized protein M8220_013292 [Acridotheres tristis]
MGQNWCGLIRHEELSVFWSALKPFSVRTWKITTLLLSLPRAVVFEQPKPRGFSTRGLCWRAPGSARAGGSAGTRGNGVPEPCPLRLCFPLRTDRESGLSLSSTGVFVFLTWVYIGDTWLGAQEPHLFLAHGRLVCTSAGDE